MATAIQLKLSFAKAWLYAEMYMVTFKQHNCTEINVDSCLIKKSLVNLKYFKTELNYNNPAVSTSFHYFNFIVRVVIKLLVTNPTDKCMRRNTSLVTQLNMQECAYWKTHRSTVKHVRMGLRSARFSHITHVPSSCTMYHLHNNTVERSRLQILDFGRCMLPFKKETTKNLTFTYQRGWLTRGAGNKIQLMPKKKM